MTANQHTSSTEGAYHTHLLQYREKLYDRKEQLTPSEEVELQTIKEDLQEQKGLRQVYIQVIELEDMNNIRKDAKMQRELLTEADNLETRLRCPLPPEQKKEVLSRLGVIYGILEPEYH
jgi:hypothetical protein